MTVPHSGRNWRLAPALIAMEAEADRIAPRRRRTSDGSIGDQSHRNRDSDHNPKGGWVDALDLSHDPKGGFDAHAHARNIVARRDPRLEYVISNRRIWSAARAREGWRPYTGVNPHTMHAHFVVKDSHRHDRSPWFGASIVLPTKPLPPPYRPPNPQPAPPPEVQPPPPPQPKPKGKLMFLCRIEDPVTDHERVAIWCCTGTEFVDIGRDANNQAVKDFQAICRTLGVPDAIRPIRRATLQKMRNVTPGVK